MLSLRINAEDENLIRNYAQMNNISVSEFVRQSAIERIEDEYDLKLYRKAMAEYEKDPEVFTLDEVEREI